MSTMEQAAETQLVTGLITEIRQKALDKWQVMVQTDGGTRTLWSSDQALIMQLYQLLNTQMTFNCRVSRYTHQQTQQPAQSLWILGTGPPSQAEQAPPTPTTTVVQPQVAQMGVMTQQPQVRTDDREAKIHRQTASKVAAQMLGFIPEDQRTLDNLFVISERLCRYYEHGLQGMSPDGQANYDPGPQGIPHGDEDIPF
jgi:hypothetical protein